uniref:Transmembrane protein 222-like n=1 Tax=Sinocyclocheilus rhinocerous TaxID=307959 RepID=A0A673JNS2_9TELE
RAADPGSGTNERIDPSISRYPYCIVWTPIPVLSWLFPFIGHMGICTSTGVIRDFAGPYFVSVTSFCEGERDFTMYNMFLDRHPC